MNALVWSNGEEREAAVQSPRQPGMADCEGERDRMTASEVDVVGSGSRR